MNEAPTIVSALMRHWGVSATSISGMAAVQPDISVCRWRHTMREAPDTELPATTLVLMLSDSESFRHRGRLSEAAPARRGALGLLARGSHGRWTFRMPADKPLEVLHLYFTHAYLDRLQQQAGGGSAEIREHLHLRDRRLQMLAHEVNAALDEGPVGRLYIDGLFAAMAAQLLAAHSANTPARAERGGLAAWQIKRVCEAMEAHLADDIGLEMLAGIAGCSPTHFSRAFKQSTGMPPFQWLLACRIERAKALLAHSAMPIAEIALTVGFAAQPQFTTSFRRITGLPPGAWRKVRAS